MRGERLVRFGTFELDHASGELFREGRRVPLQTQPAQVLRELVKRPGEVVSREELQRAIWTDGTFVESDVGLNVAVNKIRRALQDSASTPRFVETLPGRGYRFLADVRPVTPAAAQPPPGPTPSSTATAAAPRATSLPWAWSRRRWALALVVAATLAALLAWWRGDGALVADPARSVAILPFRPLLAESRDQALELGMAEAVIVKLGQLSSLRVPSTNAVRRYAATDADPLAAGRELGVESVLEGSLLRVGEELRVSARLLDVDSGTTLWAQQWDLPWTGVLGVQDSIAAEVARTLAVRLAADEEASLRANPTNTAAYEPYMRGRYLLQRSVEDALRAIELLQEATRLDPSSAAAEAALAFAYISVPLAQASTGPFVELGRQAALRALELDPEFAEAHAVLGRIAYQFGWDPHEADRRFGRALELEPDNAFALHCYANVLGLQGRIDEAFALNERALARDPTSVIANRDRAITLYAARRFDEAVAQLHKTLELDRYSSYTHGLLGTLYTVQGRRQEAVEANLSSLAFSGASADTLASLREAAMEGGLAGYWKRWLALRGAEASDYMVARAHLHAGDHDAAVAALERAYSAGSPGIPLLGLPGWDPLRDDVRFARLARRPQRATERAARD